MQDIDTHARIGDFVSESEIQLLNHLLVADSIEFDAKIIIQDGWTEDDEPVLHNFLFI